VQAARLRRGQACTSCRPSIASLSTRRLWTRPLKVLQRLSPEELREIEDGHVKLALLRQVRRSSNRSTQTRWPQRLFGLPLRARSFGTSTPIVAGRTQSEEGGCCAQPATAADRKNQSSPTSPRTSSATAPGGRCDRSPTEGSPTSRTGAPTTKEPTICRTGGSAAPSPMRRTAARASPSRRSRRHLKRSGGLAASSRPTGADRGAAAPARRPPAHRTGGVVCAIRASHGYVAVDHAHHGLILRLATFLAKVVHGGLLLVEPAGRPRLARIGHDRFRVKDRLRSVDLPVCVAGQPNRSACSFTRLSVTAGVVTQFVTHRIASNPRSVAATFLSRSPGLPAWSWLSAERLAAAA